MQKRSQTAAILVAALSCLGSSCSRPSELEGTLTLSGAWAIYPTAVAWAEAFQKARPGVRVDVSAGGAGKGAADAIAGLVDIGMVSREPDPAEIGKGITAVYVLRDAVFPVVSDKNPSASAVRAHGMSLETLSAIYVTGNVTAWDAAAGATPGERIHVYTRSDSCGAAAAWAAPFRKKQEDLKGIGVYGDPGVLQAVVRDPAGIGYNNFSYVFTRDGAVVPGIRLVPVDVNGNGMADPGELFADRKAAVAALEAGTYPFTRRNYFFVKGKPRGLVAAFIAFALSDAGTAVAEQVGTSLPVPRAEREKVLEGIN